MEMENNFGHGSHRREQPSTTQLRFLERTDILVYTVRCEIFMKNSFFKENSPFMEHFSKSMKAE